MAFGFVQIFYFCSLLCMTDALVADDFLLAADMLNVKIHQISLLTKNVESLNIPGLAAATGVIYDNRSSVVYISDYLNRTIQRCTMSGTNCVQFSTGLGYPDRMVMDFSTGNIFYTADANPSLSTGRNGYIGAVRPSQNAHLYILSGLGKPRGIALYPSKGLMFWTDHADPYNHVGRSATDGTGFTFIVTTNIRWPNGIAIDYSADRIYWIDGFYNRIESCDLNGGSRIAHLSDPGAHMVDILIKGSYLYYTAWNKRIITKVEKNTYGIVNWMSNATEFGRIDAIDIHPADSQPVHPICSNNNGNCITFCLPTPTSRTCKCNGGVSQNNDTCEQNTKCYTDLLNGKFSSQCTYNRGSSYSYECNPGFINKGGTNTVFCQEDGQWSKPTSLLCQENIAVTCNSSLPGGNIATDCSTRPGSTCSYVCNDGYLKNTDQHQLTCQLNGEWNVEVKSLCQEIRCHVNLPHGNMVSQCTGKVAEMCFYQCNEGFTKHGKLGAVICQSSGNWNTSLISICELQENISDEPSLSPIAAGIGSGIGVLIVIVGVLVVVVLCRKGLKERMYGQQTNHVPVNLGPPPPPPPPVYYTATNHHSGEYLSPVNRNHYEEIQVNVGNPASVTEGQYETLGAIKCDEIRPFVF